MPRYVIVNADDFGQSPGINQGIMQAYEQGIVTSASLMVRWPAAAEAAAYSRRHADLSLGLHVDCGEYVCRDGEWVPIYEVVPLQDRHAVADEVRRQLAMFRRLVGRDPTHIDSHQHKHRREPLRSLLIEMAEELAVPLRHYTTAVQYCGDFYGQTVEGTALPDVISIEGLTTILARLPQGYTEVSCHPALACDLDTMYCHERTAEMKVLCAPQLRAVVAALHLELCSFHTLAARAGSTTP
jgi:chitin disaccharide deacetylase